MAIVVVKHKVRNFTDWKARFDVYDSARKSAGELSYKVFYEEHAPNSLVLFLEWDTPTRAKIFFQGDTYKDFKNQSGVLGEPEIMYMGQAASGTT